MKKRRFHDRVSLERRVLTIVNGCGLFLVPLHGITDRAIEAWLKRDASGEGQQIGIILREISVKANLRVDCSKDAFDQNELSLTASLDDMIEALESTIARLHH